MSQILSFVDLVNLAIGTPELGSVNFNALHFFLQSLLEHLQLQDVKKEISKEELDFLKPPTSQPATGVPPESEQLARKSSSIFHQMHERISAIERQLSFLNDAPTTAQLLARTQSAGQPTQDMWQMMQLKKKMEVNEEGMTKAMNTLQDLLNTICSLKVAADHFQSDVENLKEKFDKLQIDEMKEHLRQLDEQTKAMEGIRQAMDSMRATASASEAAAAAAATPTPTPTPSSTPADLSDFLHWSSLCEMLLGKSFPENEKVARDQSSKELLTSLGQLPEKHEALKIQIAQLEKHLKQQAKQAGSREFLPEMQRELKSLMERMDHLQCQEEQGSESLQGALDQVQNMKEQCDKLQKAMDRIMSSSADVQSLREMLEHLDITKADKALIKEEMQVKADKSALEAKVNHGELQSATTQLSEMMQDLLQKMSLQDKDWQKALEKLFTDMDCKLDRMALDPLSKQLEEVWKFVKKYLIEGPRFDADSAAGFKKQLFERVKCISCDRPVTLMTGPHLITVRKATLRPRPASANGYEYLARQQKRDLETNEAGNNPPPQTCWQCQTHHQTCTIKRLSKCQDLATIYPYGDPTVVTYDNTEVDILGVNGVLYKGRVNSQAAERALALQKEFAAIKPPRRSGRMERARSATMDVHAYVSPYASSSVRRVGPVTINSRQPPQQQPPSPETLDGVVHSPNHLQSGGGVTGI